MDAPIALHAELMAELARLRARNAELESALATLAERELISVALEERIAERTSELEHALAELRARETWLRSILQTALDGFWVVDTQQRFVDVNEAYCVMSGYSREEILGLRISDMEAIEDHEETNRRIQQIIATGSDRFESRHRRKDGGTFDVEVSVTYIADDGLMVCFCRDITARKRAEQALERQLAVQAAVAHCSQTLLRPAEGPAERQALLEEALATLRDIIDVSHLYIFTPPAADAQGELALRILVEVYAPGQLPDTIPSPEQIKDVPRDIIDALESGHWFGGPVAGRFPAHPHFQRSYDQNGVQSILMVPIIVAGSLWGVLSAADRTRPREWGAPTVQLLRTAAEMFASVQQTWEMTQALAASEAGLRRAKEAAEAADRTKSIFLAHISHEIRTPLTAVIGMISLLRTTELSALQHDYATTIHTGAETLLTLIGNILDFSKIEAGQMELSPQPFTLRACLKEALDLVAHQARRKGLTLSQIIDPTVPSALVGDVARLRQVLVNLLSNAVKFTEHGAVTLTVSGWPLFEPGYELILAIRDTGIGIAPGRQEQIFEPFVQADSTTTRRFGGTGLGLAISRQLVELMGGQISVTSKPGVGATFMLRLPMAIAPDVVAPTPSSVGGEPREPSQLRLLLAEDNPINQEVLRRLLESLGYTPDVVSNGAEALAAVRRQPYDVVLMDIQMPELDGEAATRRIRELGGDAQPHIIALTASALRGDRERYLAAGMDDYLSKPVQREDLQAAIERQRPHHAPPTDPPAPPTDPSAPPTDPPAPPTDPSEAPDPETQRGASLVDWAMLDVLIGALGGTAEEAGAILLNLFRDTLADQMETIAAAIAADDRARVRLLAHKLRGGSRQLGATALAEHWMALELAAQREGEPLVTLLALARQTYAETLALLTARIKPPGA